VETIAFYNRLDAKQKQKLDRFRDRHGRNCESVSDRSATVRQKPVRRMSGAFFWGETISRRRIVIELRSMTGNLVEGMASCRSVC
jgi:hypothetical protein